MLILGSLLISDFSVYFITYFNHAHSPGHSHSRWSSCHLPVPIPFSVMYRWMNRGQWSVHMKHPHRESAGFRHHKQVSWWEARVGPLCVSANQTVSVGFGDDSRFGREASTGVSWLLPPCQVPFLFCWRFHTHHLRNVSLWVNLCLQNWKLAFIAQVQDKSPPV